MRRARRSAWTGAKRGPPRATDFVAPEACATERYASAVPIKAQASGTGGMDETQGLGWDETGRARTPTKFLAGGGVRGGAAQGLRAPLTHDNRDRVEAACRRSDLFERRCGSCSGGPTTPPRPPEAPAARLPSNPAGFGVLRLPGYFTCPPTLPARTAPQGRASCARPPTSSCDSRYTCAARTPPSTTSTRRTPDRPRTHAPICSD